MMVEQTLIIIKPDGVQRHLAGEIISRFERKGFKIVAAKFLQISKEVAKKHYDVHKDKPFYENTVEYISSAPVMAVVLEAEGVIEMARTMMGRTFGYEAEPGTIRGDFGSSRRFNLVHGSDSAASAEFEIPLFFTPEEIISYEFDDKKRL